MVLTWENRGALEPVVAVSLGLAEQKLTQEKQLVLVARYGTIWNPYAHMPMGLCPNEPHGPHGLTGPMAPHGSHWGS